MGLCVAASQACSRVNGNWRTVHREVPAGRSARSVDVYGSSGCSVQALKRIMENVNTFNLSKPGIH